MKTETALVTGASGGIGEAFAEIFAENKVDLILVARSKEKLESLAKKLIAKHGVRVTVLAHDLSRLEEIDQILAHLAKEQIKIDYLINNAGFGKRGFVVENEWRVENEMIELNITALTYLSKIFAQEMTGRGSGKILNVASTAAFQPGPRMAVYFATKAYVLSFTEALANELLGTGVTATALCPGPTASGFQDRADAAGSKLFKGQLPSSEEVARFGYKALLNGDVVAVHGLKNSIGTSLVKFFPRRLVTKVVRQMQ